MLKPTEETLETKYTKWFYETKGINSEFPLGTELLYQVALNDSARFHLGEKMLQKAWKDGYQQGYKDVQNAVDKDH